MWFLYLLFTAFSLTSVSAETTRSLTIHLSLGYGAEYASPFHVRIAPAGGVDLATQEPWTGDAGAGHIATHSFQIAYPDQPVRTIQDLHVIWGDLIAHSDADTVRRLTQDPAWQQDARKITILLNREGTKGFTLTIDQLLRCKAFWVPSLHLFLSTGDRPISFADYQRQIAPYRGDRILEQVHRGPEASYAEFAKKWQNMGDPAYTHPVQEGPGHIVGLGWDGSIAKFGIDRGAGVWSDEGNPDQFRFWFEFAHLAEGIIPYWKSQTLYDGLPVMTTTLVRDGVRYEIEQFAWPLNRVPQQRVGDLKMLLMQRVRMTDLTGTTRTIPVTMVHERKISGEKETPVVAEHRSGQILFRGAADHGVLLDVDAGDAKVAWAGMQEQGQKMKGLTITASVTLPAHGEKNLYVTMPSPALDPADIPALLATSYDDARTRVLNFWSSYISRGAQFDVPEKAVNDLFRASLWHALMLPRFYPDGHMDLPYSDFAYGQTGTPWPINQAVYVDYMLYGLRGYNDVALREIEAIYKNNQEPNGHVDGFAHWLAYTPGMLYAVAQNYLLSGDREKFEKELPQTLAALDWSLAEIKRAASSSGPTQGMVRGPLNDLTGPGYWAFNQAWLYAGVERMGEALERAGNPRAAECLRVAHDYREAIKRAMQIASVRSPLVELRDHTWIPYLPSEISEAGRNYSLWYPSDVDVGATHLLRLQALPPDGALADSLLNDHEDNLYLHGWGLANEPVYDQQATAYLLRDDPKAAIRTFYSLMAGGFSQGVYEPVEHRWRWGQYFGPPSTDGAWFELYRNMLVRERDTHTLLLCQAAPRAWLNDGKTIQVKRAPTWFGNLSMKVESHAASGTIRASFQLEARQTGVTVLFRLRHPEEKSLRGVMVNGQPWTDFDPKQEWIRIPNTDSRPYTIVATY
ncbi:MAG TPA: hypothetical protein VG844_04560 [Terracidiphilus sp.]|nr:hypothetical protein [Terracidiphilus sp.]